MNCFMFDRNIFDMHNNYYWRRCRRYGTPFCFITSSFLRMVLSLLLCLLHVQFMGVFGKLSYNTIPQGHSVIVTLHEPKVIANMCFLKPDIGPCRGKFRMYHYDVATKDCQSFTWGGCQGNGNRFDTRKECLKTCQTTPDYKAPVPRYCGLTFDYGFCFGAIKRYYYDKYWKVCKEALYSGCGGNKNNFYEFEQCDRICRLGLDPLPRGPDKKDKDIRKILIINPEGLKKKQNKL